MNTKGAKLKFLNTKFIIITCYSFFLAQRVVKTVCRNALTLRRVKNKIPSDCKIILAISFDCHICCVKN